MEFSSFVFLTLATAAGVAVGILAVLPVILFVILAAKALKD